MNDEIFNTSIRKFLKSFGITAQKDIEQAVTEAIAAGQLSGTEKLPIQVHLSLAGTDLDLTLEGEITLD